MKQEIISKLIVCEIDHDKTVVDIIYDEKLEDVEFVNQMIISYNNILSIKLDNRDNNTHTSSVSSKKRQKKKSYVTIKKHNTRQGSSLLNVDKLHVNLNKNKDKLNFNLNKNKIVKSNSLVIQANKKHKINEYDDVLNDNNNTSDITTKANRNNMLKNKHNKNKDKVNDESNIDYKLINCELFMYEFYLYISKYLIDHYLIL